MFDVIIMLSVVLVLWEILVILLPNSNRLYPTQYQCGDCKFVGYNDSTGGYLCCNKKIMEICDHNKVHIDRTMWLTKGISVYLANPKGKCNYYKKSLIKWLHKWNTKRDGSCYRW